MVKLSTVEYNYECPICYENMYEDFFTLECGHRFCLKCLVSWIDIHESCALCRNPINWSDDGYDLCCYLHGKIKIPTDFILKTSYKVLRGLLESFNDKN